MNGQRYRFGRDSIMYLSDVLRDKIERLTRRKTSLTVEEKGDDCLALCFFSCQWVTFAGDWGYYEA